LSAYVLKAGSASLLGEPVLVGKMMKLPLEDGKSYQFLVGFNSIACYSYLDIGSRLKAGACNWKYGERHQGNFTFYIIGFPHS